jgi:hypothetical protein
MGGDRRAGAIEENRRFHASAHQRRQPAAIER